jgi:hypothetical protein
MGTFPFILPRLGSDFVIILRIGLYFIYEHQFMSNLRSGLAIERKYFPAARSYGIPQDKA